MIRDAPVFTYQWCVYSQAGSAAAVLGALGFLHMVKETQIHLDAETFRYQSVVQITALTASEIEAEANSPVCAHTNWVFTTEIYGPHG